MKKLIIITLSILAFLVNKAVAQDVNELVNQIMKAADVNENQAKGGAGALFEMAKENLSIEDYSKVAEKVPGLDNLIGAIPNLTPKKSMLGAAAVKLSGNAKVLAIFKKLGISETKVALFTPVIVNYIETKGGKELANLFANAVK